MTMEDEMRKQILGLALAGLTGLAGCVQQGPYANNTAGAAATGAVAGAVIGQVVDDKPLEGAVIGGLAGAVAANLGRTNDGRCRYQDNRTGRTWIAAC